MASFEDNQHSLNGLKENDVHEIQIPVPWGHISGKWWGPKEVQPIVALHGRQDNAGSFDKLIPLLPRDISVLCLDMPGHGFSSHYPKGQFYYMNWEGIMWLRRITKHFKWNKVKLMGHSLGGAISFLYAAAFPDEVEFLISLDIASPAVRPIEKLVSITGSYIDRFFKFENLTEDNMPCYEYEEMIDIVTDAYGGSLTRDSAKIMMNRGMQPASKPDRYYFSRDARLKVSFLGMPSTDMAISYSKNIKCAYLNIRAMSGIKVDQPDNYENILNKIKSVSCRFEYHEVEGTHHVHLNNPERIVSIIMNFISA